MLKKLVDTHGFIFVSDETDSERKSILNLIFVFYEDRCDYFILIVHVLYLGGIFSASDPARPRDYYSGKYSHLLT